MKTRLVPLLVVAGSASLLAAPALAAPPDPAQAAFDRGVEDLEAGRFDKACPSIEQSYKLDPRPGTLFTLAECESKRGRLATALARYDEYLALYASLSADKKQKQGDREKDSRAAKAALLSQVPKITVTLPPTAPRGTVVTRDGTSLPDSALGTPLQVDPGEHVFTVRAPGGASSEHRVSVARGEKKDVVLEVTEGAAPAPAKPSGEPAAPADQGQGPNGRRVAAYVSGGVGVVGLLVGAVAGGLALGKKSTIDQNCGAKAGFPADPTACNHTGFTAAGSLATLGAASTAGFVIGGAGLVTGIVLFATEPKTPSAGSPPAGSLGLGLRGTW